jgi:hypothetical protein
MITSDCTHIPKYVAWLVLVAMLFIGLIMIYGIGLALLNTMTS